jgi:hypothetical protein
MSISPVRTWIPILGRPSRVSEVHRGKNGLSMAIVQKLRARFHILADLLLPPPKKAPAPPFDQASRGLIRAAL